MRACLGLVILCLGCNPSPRKSGSPAPAQSTQAPGPERRALASWTAPYANVPSVTAQGDGRRIAIAVALGKPGMIDERARSVVLLLGPCPECAGSALVHRSCADGDIVAEIDRATFEAARDLHGAASVRLELTPPDPERTYALMACLRDKEGKLATIKEPLARPASARVDTIATVLTPSGPIAAESYERGAIVGYDPAAGAPVRTQIRRASRTNNHDCLALRFDDGKERIARVDARYWLPDTSTFRDGAALAIGDRLLDEDLRPVRIVSRREIGGGALEPGCGAVPTFDVGWPDTYFERGLLVHDDSSLPSPHTLAAPIAAAPGELAAPAAMLRPEPQSYDCQLSLRLDVGRLPEGTRAVAIAASPYRGLPGQRTPARCDTVVAEVPRNLLDRVSSLALGRAPSLTLEVGSWTGAGAIACDREYAVAACLRDASGTLRPVEPLARYGKAGPVCLAEGTLVDTIDGPRPVESLHVGAVLRGLELDEERPVPAALRQLRIHEDRRVATFQLSSGAELRVTAEHPIYVVERGAFVPARDVHAGATLLARDGTRVLVRSRTAFDQPARVYNLTVDAPHDYFASGVLVHNY